MNGMNMGGKYTPSSTIKTEPLTSKYNILGDIGRGKFAVVRKCVDIGTGEMVAAKVIRKRRKGKSCREEILREVVMLEYAMAHPRLVSLREVFETPSELILVTEFCAGGELFHECVIEESFKEHDVVLLMVQILEGLCFLHENNIVHLDLKPQNILLTEPFPKGSIKICDLGFACLTNTGEDIRDIIGTPDYVAPEVLDYEPLSIQTDMWSLGVLSYVMLTACSPFAGDNQQETFCNISQVKLDFPDDLFSHISPHAKDFIKKLLVKDPRHRMTARQCLDHPWLKAAGAEMHVSLPADDKAASLASHMVPPSNWNPDRRNSVGVAPTSPLIPRTAKTASPGVGAKDQPRELATTVEGDMKRQKESAVDESCNASALCAHNEDLLSHIDKTSFDGSGTGSPQMDTTPSNKRLSMEIPTKKAKCVPASPERGEPDCDLTEQEERVCGSVANGSSISVDMGDLSVTPDCVSENAVDTTSASADTSATAESQRLQEVECINIKL